MSTLAIVQARMTSSRFPGKVLADLLGSPMITRQLERLQRAQLVDKIVVATSNDPSDDNLSNVIEAMNIPVVRGSLNDVLGRFIQVIDEFNPDVIVRITADCPLISPQVVDGVIQLFHDSNADYASNTLTPTFPDGLDVEVCKVEALRKINQISTDDFEREHVTLGIYRRPELFSLRNFENPEDYSFLRWTVDTPADLDFVRGVYQELFKSTPNFDMEEVLAYLKLHPERSRTVNHAMRNAALHGKDTGAMNV